MLVIGATGCLSWLMTVEQVATTLAEWVKNVAHQPWVFLLLTNVALLLLGTFIEPLPATLLTAPLFMPLAQVFKIDMLHFGVIMTANLAIPSTPLRWEELRNKNPNSHHISKPDRVSSVLRSSSAIT